MKEQVYDTKKKGKVKLKGIIDLLLALLMFQI